MGGYSPDGSGDDHGRAIRANPLSEQERAQVARAKAGDVTGLLAHDEHGDWVRL